MGSLSGKQINADRRFFLYSQGFCLDGTAKTHILKSEATRETALMSIWLIFDPLIPKEK
jgi:hypothetical protein